MIFELESKLYCFVIIHNACYCDVFEQFEQRCCHFLKTVLCLLFFIQVIMVFHALKWSATSVCFHSSAALPYFAVTEGDMKYLGTGILNRKTWELLCISMFACMCVCVCAGTCVQVYSQYCLSAHPLFSNNTAC